MRYEGVGLGWMASLAVLAACQDVRLAPLEGGGGAGGEGPASGGAAGHDLTGGGGGGGELPVSRNSYVVVYTALDGEPPTWQQGGAYAGFELRRANPLELVCDRYELGPCSVRRCVEGAGGGTGGGPSGTGSSQTVSAGRISIGGGTFPIELEPNADGLYDTAYETAPFLGGETLSFSVEGSVDVPAFTAQVVAPTPPLFTNLDGAGPFEAVPGQPFSLTWAPVETGTVSVRLQQGSRGGEQVDVSCAFDRELGSAEVPGEVTALLFPASTAELSGWAYRRQVVDAPPWATGVMALAYARTGTGELALALPVTVP